MDKDAPLSDGVGGQLPEQSHDASRASNLDSELPQQVQSGGAEMSMNMSSLANTLPNYGSRGSQQIYHHPPPSGPVTSMVYQYPHGHYTGTAPNQAAPFAQQLSAQYQGQRMYDNYQTNHNMSQPTFSNAMYMPNQPMMSASMPSQYTTFQHGPMFQQVPDNRYVRNPMYQPMHGYGTGQGGQAYAGQHASDSGHNFTSSPSIHSPSALRGPPRKPRQSGHALWVGNLPPGANIVDLKDHFARDATQDIESVFLISKSNCAFVNYKSDESCAAAMSRFHDSRFQGVRLVCRLRRGVLPPSPANASNETAEGLPVLKTASQATSMAADTNNVSGEIEEQAVDIPSDGDTKIKERFFVIKSLTIEDLERSVQTGIWATQSHNEVALNKAYKTAEDVYLIFSANKSGEYFGYARMESPIDDEAAAQIANESPEVEQKPVTEAHTPSTSSALPMTIPTPATATAPRGHIIDDSARGTIFWEAESSEHSTEDHKNTPLADNDEAVEAEQNAQSPSSISPNPDQTTMQTTFGKPFKISWQSTDRLPFYRTRGLRNPWNTNREVKIARDGTEIEPSIGRKLVDMFGTQPPVQPRTQPNYSGPLIVGPGFGPPPQGPGYGRGY